MNDRLASRLRIKALVSTNDGGLTKHIVYEGWLVKIPAFASVTRTQGFRYLVWDNKKRWQTYATSAMTIIGDVVE